MDLCTVELYYFQLPVVLCTKLSSTILLTECYVSFCFESRDGMWYMFHLRTTYLLNLHFSFWSYDYLLLYPGGPFLLEIVLDLSCLVIHLLTTKTNVFRISENKIFLLYLFRLSVYSLILLHKRDGSWLLYCYRSYIP